MKSVAPESLKQAITEAYNPNNSEGKRELWNTILQVIRHGLSYEQGNPWKEILKHWDKEEKKHKAAKRKRYQLWTGNQSGYSRCGHHRARRRASAKW